MLVSFVDASVDAWDGICQVDFAPPKDYDERKHESKAAATKAGEERVYLISIACICDAICPRVVCYRHDLCVLWV
jgi:hypothetical protein